MGICAVGRAACRIRASVAMPLGVANRAPTKWERENEANQGTAALWSKAAQAQWRMTFVAGQTVRGTDGAQQAAARPSPNTTHNQVFPIPSSVHNV